MQQQAGEGCDVILGMGHDPNLKEKISVTVIATGFNHKAINIELPARNNEPKKIKVELGDINNTAEVYTQEARPIIKQVTSMSPTLVETPVQEFKMPDLNLNIFGYLPAQDNNVKEKQFSFF